MPETYFAFGWIRRKREKLGSSDLTETILKNVAAEVINTDFELNCPGLIPAGSRGSLMDFLFPLQKKQAGRPVVRYKAEVVNGL